MTKEQLNTILIALETGRALHGEAVDQLSHGSDFLDSEDLESLQSDLDNDLDFLNEAISIVKEALK